MATVHLLHGLPGTGKTVLAGKLEIEHRAILLCHDMWMVTLHGIDPPAEEFGRYAADITNLMWTLTERLIARDVDVVLDWGFWTRVSRDEARARIVAAGGKSRLYRMACPAAVARGRTIARSNASAAGVLAINGAAWDSFAARFEPLGNDEERIEEIRALS